MARDVIGSICGFDPQSFLVQIQAGQILVLWMKNMCIKTIKLGCTILILLSGCHSSTSPKSSDDLKSSAPNASVDNFGKLAWCITGPDIAPMRGCEGYDLDADFDVDLYDWAGWTLDDSCLVAICEIGTICVQGRCTVE